MFALLAPAGFAVVVGVKKRIDAHNAWKAAQKKQEAQNAFRGAAAGALPDEELAVLRQRAAIATERIAGLEGLLEEMRDRLEAQGKERDRLERDGKTKILEYDHLRKKNEMLARDVCQKAAEAEALLQRAERSRDLAAKSANAADAASKALVVISEAMLRWREELVVCSLERGSVGQAPSAKKIMEVISDIDNELSVTVMSSDLLPTECKARLEAKRAELKLKKECGSVQSTSDWEYQPTFALSAPDKLARLVASSGASTSSAPATHAPVEFPRVETPAKLRTKPGQPATSGGKENTQSKPPSTSGARDGQGLPVGFRDPSPSALSQTARAGEAGGSCNAGYGPGTGEHGTGGAQRAPAGAGATGDPRLIGVSQPHLGTGGGTGGAVEAYLLPASDRSFARYKSLKLYAKAGIPDERAVPDVFTADTVPLSELSRSSSQALSLLKGK